jgi:hypothetical protein
MSADPHRRGEAGSARAASNSDYHLTGLITRPECGRKYIGASATGKLRRYRYYTCFSRARYGRTGCTAPRIDADQLAKLGQLTARRADLTELIGYQPKAPSVDAIARLRQDLAKVLDHGTPGQRKAVMKTHIAEIKIQGTHLIPIFRIPADDEGPADTPAVAGSGSTHWPVRGSWRPSRWSPEPRI